MQGKTYSEFIIGERFVTARRTITQFDVMQFVTFTGFIEPLFLDHHFIQERSLARVPIAPGGLTFVLAEGLAVQTGMIHGTGRAFVGIRRMQLSAPVLIDDTIQSEVIVLEKKYKPALAGGIVTFLHRVFNSNRVLVMEYEILRLIADAPYVDAID